MNFRLFVELSILFLLPTLLVGGYRLAARGDRSKREAILTLPFGWLFLSGAVLMYGALTAFASRGGNAPDAPYNPAVFRDGTLTK